MTFAAQDTVNHLNVVQLLGGAQRNGSPVIGFVAPANRALVDSILNTPLAKQKLPSDFRAVWEVKAVEVPVADAQGNPVMKGNGEYKTTPYWQLIALKGEAALEGDAVTSATSEFEGYEKTKEQLFKSMSEDIRKEYIDTIPTIGGGNRRS